MISSAKIYKQVLVGKESGFLSFRCGYHADAYKKQCWTQLRELGQITPVAETA
jgi:hypothetical protein